MTKSRTGSQELRTWHKQTSFIVAGCQLALVGFLTLVFFFSPRPVEGISSIETLTGKLLLVYCFIAIAGIAMLTLEKWRPILDWCRLATDLILLTLVILSFPMQYHTSPEAALKAPTMLYFFALIALQAMRLSTSHIIVAGLLATACWTGIILVSLSSSATITQSYIEYVTGTGILIGAEIEKIISLLAFTVIMAIAVHRGNLALNASVEAKIQMTKAISEAKVLKATNASKAKSDFLAKISHELRTPMNGISGVVEEFSKEKLSARDQEKLGVLQQSSQNMMSVLNNILDVTSIENNDVIIDEKPFCLKKIVSEVMSEEEPAAKRKNIALTSTLPDDLPVLMGDERRIKVVVHHLVNNAIGFTDHGHVDINVDLSTQDGRADLVIEIEDTGHGIPDEVHDTIFSLFEQIDNSKTRMRDGLGLGLSISKALTEKMGGTLSFISEVGKGTTFTINLSMPIATNVEMIHAAPKKLSHPEGYKPSILIAEDNMVNQMVIKTFLPADQYQTTIANDGLEAIAALEQQDFDLVLMDLSMPNMDGITATKEIRQTRSDLPILALTAHISDETRDECVKAGMNDYLTKPINKAVLEAAIETHLLGEAKVAI